jgi:hypothetical protein
MIINEEALSQEIEQNINRLRKRVPPALILIMSSSVRKRILKKGCEEEIERIKQTVGDETPVVGFFSDYQVAFDKNAKEFIIETGNVYIISFG